jgi:2-iminobutanoate/2-iminopropanoate deaminase
MKKIIFTDKGPSPIGPYSQAVSYGNTIYVSGQVAINPANSQLVMTDIGSETKQIMENIGEILKEAGFEYKDIVKATIFLRDMQDFKAMNEIYGIYFMNNFPARETVAVSGLPLNVNVEISVIAIK